MLDAAGGDSDREINWRQVQKGLKSQYGEPTYDSWFRQIKCRPAGDDAVVLLAPTRFVRDWIKSQYLEEITALWRKETGKRFDIDVVVDAQAAACATARPSVGASAPAPSAASQPSRKSGAPVAASTDNIELLGAPLDERQTFENFVIGKSNEFAYAAARRVADRSAIAFNPLYLYGGSGLGKTHLMHAIAWEVRRRNKDRKVLYLSAETFMFHFVQALRYKDTIAFKEKFRAVDVLMIDDVQFIGNKDSTQEEFFHTFNALIDHNRQIVISADRSPSDLESAGVQERIRQRLGKGLTADVHSLDYELRFGILQSKLDLAQRDYPGLTVPNDVLEFIARKIVSHARDLEGALNRLVAHAMFVGGRITIDAAQDLLRDQMRAHERRVTLDDIQKHVCEYYGVRLTDMLSSRRARAIARPRQVAMHLSKALTTASLPEIGRKFGGRDHTTVIHAIRKIDQLMAEDGGLASEMAMLQRILSG